MNADEIAEGGWIMYNYHPSRCPTDTENIVDVIWSDGSRDTDIAGDWNWWGYEGNVITHWRLHKAEEESSPAEKLVEKFHKQAKVSGEGSGQVVSDGGSSDYYKLKITNKAGETIECETGDILRAMVGNDYDLSNIVKACRRMYEASQGRGKAGATIAYDARKIEYFAKEFSHWNRD